MEIKKVEFKPNNTKEFIKCIESLDIDIKIKDFLKGSIDLGLSDVDDVDDFYIDDYEFNFYNYKQKQTPLDKIHFFKNGYKNKELNPFTFEFNYYKDGEYIKLKNKIGYDNYYNYICLKHGNMRQEDKFIFVKPYTNDMLNDKVHDENIIRQFIDFLIDNFKKGLWVNNFNNYSIRYDGIDMYAHDPDIFYIIHDNDALRHITNVEDFIRMYMKVKTRPKNIIYRLKHNVLSKEAAEYFYYTFWFIENVSQYLRKHYDY